MGTGGDDDMTCMPGAAVGDDAEAGAAGSWTGCHFHDGRVRDDRRTERRCVAFQVLHQLTRAQVAVGIGSGIVPARQPGHPGRSEQVQRVPALATPALRHLTPIEHDVITLDFGKHPAHGQAGVSRANNDSVDDHH